MVLYSDGVMPSVKGHSTGTYGASWKFVERGDLPEFMTEDWRILCILAKAFNIRLMSMATRIQYNFPVCGSEHVYHAMFANADRCVLTILSKGAELSNWHASDTSLVGAVTSIIHMLKENDGVFELSETDSPYSPYSRDNCLKTGKRVDIPNFTTADDLEMKLAIKGII